MAHDRTPEEIESEAKLVRLQLLASGACIWERARPARLVDSVKSVASRKMSDVGAQVAQSSNAASLVLLGGTIVYVLMMMARPPRRRDPVMPVIAADVEAALRASEKPSLSTELKAAALSALGIGLGYVAGSAVPRSKVEDEFFGPVREVVSRETSKFIDTHAEGMKQSAANLFGLSRIAAATLATLAVIADQTKAKRS
jgi:hypothetical protein